MNLQIVPESVAVRATNTVLNEVIVRLSDPEAARRLISVETRPAASHIDKAVVVEEVLLLNSILDEDVVALYLVDKVVHDLHIVSAVQSVGAVESLMGRATLHIRLVDCTNLVEVHSIATDLEALADVSHLDVFDATNQAIVSIGMQEDIGTILVGE